jgi:hypothetical protein
MSVVLTAGGGTTAEQEIDNDALFLFSIVAAVPTGQAGNQKHPLVLPPCMFAKVAVGWWPGNCVLQTWEAWAQAPCDQQ